MTTNYQLVTQSGAALSTKAPNVAAPTQPTVDVRVRCPHCMVMGSFVPVMNLDLSIQHRVSHGGGIQTITGSSVSGLRTCPNPDCMGLIFFVSAGSHITTFPSEVIDFDSSEIPVLIAASFSEAIKCHSAGCYKAAALMVRRTLEELCEDRGADGKDLKGRIEALAKKVIIPPELIEAADHLRLLGNDAAHVKAKTYESIGEEEVRIAIDLVKELLKGAYQLRGLVSRLAALQRQP